MNEVKLFMRCISTHKRIWSRDNQLNGYVTRKKWFHEIRTKSQNGQKADAFCDRKATYHPILTRWAKMFHRTSRTIWFYYLKKNLINKEIIICFHFSKPQFQMHSYGIVNVPPGCDGTLLCFVMFYHSGVVKGGHYIDQGSLLACF